MKHNFKTMEVPGTMKGLNVEGLQSRTKYVFSIESYNELGSSGESMRTLTLETTSYY